MRTSALQAWEQAARTCGVEPPPRHRPNPALWLKYAAWGRLPDRHRGWVLFDTTTSTWILRHFARMIVLVAPPLTALALWLPTDGSIRALTCLTTGLCAIMFPTLYVNEATDHRLEQAGWPRRSGRAFVRPAGSADRASPTRRAVSGQRREKGSNADAVIDA
jgi:hypothetical protein